MGFCASAACNESTREQVRYTFSRGTSGASTQCEHSIAMIKHDVRGLLSLEHGKCANVLRMQGNLIRSTEFADCCEFHLTTSETPTIRELSFRHQIHMKI